MLLELRERDITAVIFGGSQDLGRGVFLALEKHEGLHQILTIDSMLDFSMKEDDPVNFTKLPEPDCSPCRS